MDRFIWPIFKQAIWFLSEYSIYQHARVYLAERSRYKQEAEATLRACEEAARLMENENKKQRQRLMAAAEQLTVLKMLRPNSPSAGRIMVCNVMLTEFDYQFIHGKPALAEIFADGAAEVAHHFALQNLL